MLQHGELIPRRIEIRSKARYILKLDISQFYNSIYTHSIPWAIDGKEQAKRQRRAETIGNQLDKHVRKLQDDQTSGIPTGPDCSLIIAECVLTGVATELASRAPSMNGLRHIDDYEIGCQSYSEVDEMISAVQASLNTFELELNAQKTDIRELPAALNPEWMSDLRRIRVRTATAQQQQRDLLDFFDRVIELEARNATETVLTYGLRVMNGQDIYPENWAYIERMLFQIIRNKPSHIRDVLSVVIKNHDKEFDLDFDGLCEALNTMITEKGRAGHSNEVAWALWGLMRMGLPVDSEAATMVSESEDSTVALLCLDAYSRGLVPEGLDTDNWQEMCMSDELFGENWLLAYEAPLKGWLEATDDYLQYTAPFSEFGSSEVSFYDRSLVEGISLTGASTVGGRVPLFSR